MLLGRYGKYIHKKYKSLTQDEQMRRFSSIKCCKPAKKSENFWKLLGDGLWWSFAKSAE